jgi:hypothetical protein
MKKCVVLSAAEAALNAFVLAPNSKRLKFCLHFCNQVSKERTNERTNERNKEREKYALVWRCDAEISSGARSFAKTGSGQTERNSTKPKKGAGGVFFFSSFLLFFCLRTGLMCTRQSLGTTQPADLSTPRRRAVTWHRRQCGTSS